MSVRVLPVVRILFQRMMALAGANTAAQIVAGNVPGAAGVECARCVVSLDWLLLHAQWAALYDRCVAGEDF